MASIHAAPKVKRPIPRIKDARDIINAHLAARGISTEGFAALALAKAIDDYYKAAIPEENVEPAPTYNQ